jgi:ABC-type branched-subunit amino acid transport system substrate-binding protein
VIRRLAAASAFVLLAAACGGGGDSAQGPQPGPSGSGGTPRPDVVVGLLYTVGGLGGEFAQAALGVADLVVEDAADSGINVGIESADYEGVPKKALKAAKDLAGRGVAGIVVASDDPEVAAALASFDEVPLIYALGSDDGAVDAQGTTFRMAPSNQLQAQKIAEFLADHRGYDKVAILHDNSDFGREGAADLEDELGFGGAEVVLNAEFKPGGDVHTPVSYAGQLGAQALVVWSKSTAEAGRITIDVHKSTQSYQLVLSGNLAVASYGKNASSQVVPVAFRDGILSVGTWAGPWFDEDAASKSFFSRFKSEQNAFAPVQAVQVYDGLLLLTRAADRAGGDPGSVAAEIESTQNFRAAGVPVSFSSSEHEGVGFEDMAIWGFTRNQDSDGGIYFPEVDTGGGFFTIVPSSVTLPDAFRYLLPGGADA